MKTLEARLQTAAAFRTAHVAYEPNQRPVQWDTHAGMFRAQHLFPRDPQLEHAKSQEQIVFAQNPLTRKQANALLRQVRHDGLTGELLDETTQKIRATTTALATADELEAYQTSRTLLVVWNKNDCAVNGETVEGMYFEHPDGANIHIRRRKPSGFETLQELTRRGRLPFATQVYVHEKTHAVQADREVKKTGPAELHEVQARRTEQPAPGTVPDYALVEHLTDSPVYREFDPRKIKAAVWSIDRLKALGYTEVEIADLTKGAGKWHKRFGGWSNVDEAINAHMARKGMDDVDLERAVMLGDIGVSTSYLLARNTAQDLLRGLFDEDLFVRVGRPARR